MGGYRIDESLYIGSPYCISTFMMNLGPLNRISYIYQ